MRQPFNTRETCIGHPRIGEIQVFQRGQGREVWQARVGDLRRCQVEVLELRQSCEVRQTMVRYRRSIQQQDNDRGMGRTLIDSVNAAPLLDPSHSQ